MPRTSRQKDSLSIPKKQAHEPSNATPNRRSKRIKSSPVTLATPKKTTPKKSQFFGHESTYYSSEPESVIEREASGYEDEDESASAVSSPPESEVDQEEDYTSAEEAPRKRKPGRKPGRKSTSGTVTASEPVKGQELWRPGVKTGLAPGEAMFIKLPKAREAGKTPYQDDTVHPNTMAFLGDLKENNDREWLKGEAGLRRHWVSSGKVVLISMAL